MSQARSKSGQRHGQGYGAGNGSAGSADSGTDQCSHLDELRQLAELIDRIALDASEGLVSVTMTNAQLRAVALKIAVHRDMLRYGGPGVMQSRTLAFRRTMAGSANREALPAGGNGSIVEELEEIIRRATGGR